MGIIGIISDSVVTTRGEILDVIPKHLMLLQGINKFGEVKYN